ncbi:hypothetical protein HOK021_49490 [Streptomyces hygroscopicus]|nr:hypothetical protein HOK021_49490 [Streptomyces hygroscopicus]
MTGMNARAQSPATVRPAPIDVSDRLVSEWMNSIVRGTYMPSPIELTRLAAMRRRRVRTPGSAEVERTASPLQLGERAHPGQGPSGPEEPDRLLAFR